MPKSFNKSFKGQGTAATVTAQLKKISVVRGFVGQGKPAIVTRKGK